MQCVQYFLTKPYYFLKKVIQHAIVKLTASLLWFFSLDRLAENFCTRQHPFPLQEAVIGVCCAGLAMCYECGWSAVDSTLVAGTGCPSYQPYA